MDTLECDVLIAGAGVIGLAIAAELSRDRSVIVVEPYDKFGQETSSRNSEVVHSGIYYPPGSRKTEWCIAGRDRLYAFCAEQGLPIAAVGKYVVATKPEEEAYLDKLYAHCRSLDVPVERKTKAEIQGDEPLIVVSSGLFLPKTGVVDSHQYMQALETRAVNQGATVAYRHRLENAGRQGESWISEVSGADGAFQVKSPWVVNAAGLAAATLSNRVLQTARYEHRYCRGRYFTLSSRYQNRFHRLIYPVPPKDGLGIHITVDLAGQARLGPDVHWCEDSDHDTRLRHYDCNWDELRPTFGVASRRYCPQIADRDLSPGLIGIRPKLFLEGQAFPDFLVENQGGFIHCLGIESPGLTSSLPIASHVRSLMG